MRKDFQIYCRESDYVLNLANSGNDKTAQTFKYVQVPRFFGRHPSIQTQSYAEMAEAANIVRSVMKPFLTVREEKVTGIFHFICKLMSFENVLASCVCTEYI